MSLMDNEYLPPILPCACGRIPKITTLRPEKDARAMFTGLYVIAATAHFNGRLANRLLLDCGIHSFLGNRIVSLQFAVTTKKNLQKNLFAIAFLA